MSEPAMKRYASTIGRWTMACVEARKAFGAKGFVVAKKGSVLYNSSAALQTLSNNHIQNQVYEVCDLICAWSFTAS